MSRIDCKGEIGAITLLVRQTDRLVHLAVKIGAGLGHQKPACRKSDDTNLVRIDMPFLRMVTNQSYRSLGILQRRHGRSRPSVAMVIAFALPTVRFAWNAILQQDSSHAKGIQPVAYLCALEINSQYPKATTGKYNHRSTRVISLGRIDRHRGSRDIGYVSHPVTGDQALAHPHFSGPGKGMASGGVPGQIEICSCPADGCHTAAFA